MARMTGGWLVAIMIFSALPGSATAGEYHDLFAAFGVPLKGVVLQAEKAIEAGDYKRAHDLLQPEADAGNADAQTLLGLMYVSGQGVETSNSLARTLVMQTLLCAAADQGHPLAMSFAESAECE